MTTSAPGGPRLDEILSSADRDARYALLSEGSTVIRGSHFGGVDLWIVTGYAEAVSVLTDPRFSNDLSGQDAIPLPGANLPEDLRSVITSTLAAIDPPNHTRLRRLVARAFTASRTRRLRPRVAQIVEGLLAGLTDRAGPDGTVDVMEQFAHQLPILVIGELLGVPPADQVRWRSSAAGLASGDPTRIEPSARALIAFMREAIALRRSGQGAADDLLTTLTRPAEDGDRLTEDELVSMALSILIAGHRTTAFLVRTMAVLVLSGAVECSDPAGIPALVEEILRRHGPAEVGTVRIATEPVDLAGATIAPGDLVQVVLASGNRDQRRFTEPSVIDPARQDNAHLAFGHGMHYCLGAALARTMAQEALAGLLRYAPAMTPTHTPTLVVTNPTAAQLPVRILAPDRDRRCPGREGGARP